MKTSDEEHRLYDLHAAVCKTFANPWRLRIVEALGGGERTVSELVALLGVPKSNVSQHLGIMRGQGVVAHRRDGAHVFYRLTNPKILLACRLMREVLIERIEGAAALSHVQTRANSDSAAVPSARRSAR